MLNILHAGCGTQPLPAWMPQGREVRLDIDQSVSPDHVAPLTDMGDIGPFELSYCSHTLEHLPPLQVQKALAEFKRVLVPGGVAVFVVPNLEGIIPDETVIYESPAGPITGRDMYYGKADFVEANPYMAHKTGFTSDTLKAELERAGFKVISCDRSNFNLMVAGQA